MLYQSMEERRNWRYAELNHRFEDLERKIANGVTADYVDGWAAALLDAISSVLPLLVRNNP